MIQAPSPTRAALLFSILLMMLVTIGTALQQHFRLTGIVLLQIAVFLGVPLLFARLLDHRGLREILRLRWLSPMGVLKSVLLGLSGWALAHVITSMLLILVELLGGTLYEPYQELMAGSFLAALLVGALLPSICEEIAFRGYIQWNLKALGPNAAVAVTGLLFGMMHLSLIRLIPLALLGSLFALAVQRTGSLVTGMIMHFVNNGTIIALAFVLQGLDRVSLGPEIGTANEALASMAVLALTAAALGSVVTALLRSLSRADLAGNGTFDQAESDPVPSTVVPLPVEHWAVVLPLLPAIGLYLLAVLSELRLVFGAP